ncbi:MULTISPECIES: hypothetical protein [unclassified Anabaena]|uniref:hypothetical protein n=1 Tax=unclassified Anabaena TaxID=2619674 RepID=UPI0039C712CB
MCWDKSIHFPVLIHQEIEENWTRAIADIRSELGLILKDDQLEKQPNKAIAS